ncbi:MAG: hypothetical protein MJ097_00940 [Dorea sp.]|nr:hypothetical protein [Dorea sp.]
MENSKRKIPMGFGRNQAGLINGFQSRILLEDLHDELFGALIGLSRVCSNNPKTEKTGAILLEGLLVLARAENSSVGWVEPSDPRVLSLKELIQKVHEDKYTIAPDCLTCQTPCGNTSDYDLNIMRLGDAVMFGHKLHILRIATELAKIFGGAGYAFPEALQNYLLKALYSVAEEWTDQEFADVINEGEGYLEKLR